MNDSWLCAYENGDFLLYATRLTLASGKTWQFSQGGPGLDPHSSSHVWVYLFSHVWVITPYMCMFLSPHISEISLLTCASPFFLARLPIITLPRMYEFTTRAADFSSHTCKSLEDPIIWLGIILFPYVQVSWGHSPLTRNLKKKKKKSHGVSAIVWNLLLETWMAILMLLDYQTLSCN